MRMFCCKCGYRTEDHDDTCPACRARMEPAPAPLSAESDPARILKIWHQGRSLTATQQAIIGDLMTANSIAMAAHAWKAV